MPKRKKTSILFSQKNLLNQLKGVISTSGADKVQVDYTEKNVVFTAENFVLTCIQIDGKFPNYSAVIPTENPNILLVDRLQLINTLQRVSIFANQSHPIKYV